MGRDRPSSPNRSNSSRRSVLSDADIAQRIGIGIGVLVVLVLMGGVWLVIRGLS